MVKEDEVQDAGFPVIAILVLFLPLRHDTAGNLRIVTCNLEHLVDTHGEGCLVQQRADYDALVRRIAELNGDIDPAPLRWVGLCWAETSLIRVKVKDR